MKRTDVFEVAAPLPRTWAALLDVARMAQALPGATVAPETVDGAHRATLRAGDSEYAGSVRVQDVDEDEHVATFYVQGHEAAGAGMAAATITGRVSERDGATRIVVETDLRVTGARARPEAAAGILARLAAALEHEAGAPATSPAEPAPAPAAPAPAAPAPLALGGAALQPVIERAAVVAAGLAIGVFLYRAVRRR